MSRGALSPAHLQQLREASGHAPGRARPIGGGDSFAAVLIELGPQTWFVKLGAPGDAATFEAEADGLRWLAEAGVIRVPQVHAVGREPAPLLALEAIAARPGDDDRSQAALGHALAQLHAAGAPGFGHRRDNVCGRVAQDNRTCDDWPTFFATRRLLPLLRRARDETGLAPPLVHAIESIAATAATRVGPPEPPSRLHGDLWRGNVLFDAHDRPVLVDPAVYGGHREVDLAMMRLFGGFAPACFAAYERAAPLAAGASQRVALYQLVPLLVHVIMFGGSWTAALRRAVAACG